MKVSFYRNSYSDNTHKEVVEVLERLPEIGEVVYDKYGQTETEFTFYRLTVEFKDSGDDDADDYDKHIAIKKEEA